jgi:hypothetical protein
LKAINDENIRAKVRGEESRNNLGGDIPNDVFTM